MKRNFSLLFVLVSLMAFAQIEEKKLDELIEQH